MVEIIVNLSWFLFRFGLKVHGGNERICEINLEDAKSNEGTFLWITYISIFRNYNQFCNYLEHGLVVRVLHSEFSKKVWSHAIKLAYPFPITNPVIC